MVKVGDVWRWETQYIADWKILGFEGDKTRCELIANTHPDSLPLGHISRLSMDTSKEGWKRIKTASEIEYV
jgi:hypothetical protein